MHRLKKDDIAGSQKKKISSPVLGVQYYPWTTFQNLVPTLPIIQLSMNNIPGSNLSHYEASSGATKGFIILFSSYVQ